MGVRPDGRGEASRQAKVGHLDGKPGAVDEDVLRLQVSVQHPMSMAELNAPQDLQHDVLHSNVLA